MNIQKIDNILHSEKMAAQFDDEEARIDFAITLAIDDLSELVKMFPNKETLYIYDAVIGALMAIGNKEWREETELYKKAYKQVDERLEKYKKDVQINENNRR